MKRFPFKKVETFLDKFDHSFVRINWGGCAAAAHMLAKVLEPHVDELKIVAYDNSVPNPAADVSVARNNIDSNTIFNWNRAGIAFNHVWVEFKWRGRWYAIDAEGIQPRRRMYEKWGKPFRGSFTLKEMKELSESRWGWNPTFDHGQVPAMKRMVNRQLRSILEASYC